VTLRTIALVGGLSFERDTPPDEVLQHLTDPNNLIWVDILDPTEKDLGVLMEVFDFHPLAIEDVAKGHQRPKVDEYKGYVFVVSYAVVHGEKGRSEFRTVEVDLFVGKNYLVSVHRERVPALEAAETRWMKGREMLREGVGFLVYSVIDEIVDGYFPVVEAIEHVLDSAEEKVVRGPQDREVEGLLAIRRDVLKLRRVLYPMRESFAKLTRRDRPLFSAATHIYFQDVYDHILRVLDLIDIQRDMVTSTLDASMTIVSNRLNATMKRLTTISVIAGFAGATFGAWGMNVHQLPFAATEYGFPMIVGGTIIVLIVMLVLGRTRGWL
jgi:magnesium transporter